MVDISAIAGMVTALNGAVNISKTMMGLHDTQAMQSKVIELNSKILEAQSSAFAANDERTALIQRITELEGKLVHLEAWERQKDRYELQRLPPETYLYALKNGVSPPEPMHYACPKCYEHRKRSILHGSAEMQGLREFTCHECGSKFGIGHFRTISRHQDYLDD